MQQVTVSVPHSQPGRACHFASNLPIVLIAGPCTLQSLDHAQHVQGTLLEYTAPHGMGLIFKSSYDKANRTSVAGVRGLGMDAAMEIFDELRKTSPVITDVHTAEQATIVANHVDMLQIPAFLSRQTDLLVAAGETQKPINVKKGQFLSPHDMAHVAKKIASTGNTQITLCERGASFGYNTLVVDMPGLAIMAASGYPVVIDATHAVQRPGGGDGKSSGDRRLAQLIARAAVAVGVAGVFIETHEAPDTAPSDGPNMIALADMKGVIATLAALDGVAKAHPPMFDPPL